MTIPDVPTNPEEPTGEPAAPEAPSAGATTEPAAEAKEVGSFKALITRLPLWARIAIPAAVVVVIAVIVLLAILAAQPSKFTASLDSCGLESNSAARIGDAGQSLILDMEGEEDWEKLTYNEVFCVLDELEVPDSVTAQMGETRSLDGRQTAEWDDIKASWSYHPDDGLDLILSFN
ncbi:hypothetical protein [Salinibacterium sp. SWN248]|uniref:hypothetical protein n=1 Tax=Salinibacterium sp. SWN248 TaxID=2792056 RepID=UPI0018CE224D|nr:hypothetical protein [Salinibacterium sp. SWN248]MBH0023975.1 hypothetical protein [Salinibacterium sp. SWN248]